MTKPQPPPAEPQPTTESDTFTRVRDYEVGVSFFIEEGTEVGDSGRERTKIDTGSTPRPAKPTGR